MRKFPIEKSGKRSQCWQDLFVYNICGTGGTYIEIGGSWPIKNSNTYGLEKFAYYKGFSIELDKETYFDSWLSSRKNKIYWDNALTFNYKEATKENNMPMHINYLSCDIEPPSNTFNALKKVISDGLTFDVITFEHEKFKSDQDYNKLATELLNDNGYKVAVSDVWHKETSRIFETWYVKKTINFKEKTFDSWKTINNIK